MKCHAVEWVAEGAGEVEPMPADHKAVLGNGAACRGGGGHPALGTRHQGARMAVAGGADKKRPPARRAAVRSSDRHHQRSDQGCGRGRKTSFPVRWRPAIARCGRPDNPAGQRNRNGHGFGIAPWSAHDLRRSALTGMARLGIAPIVLGHVANHRTTTRAGVTLAVYSQYTYDKEKRAALDLWAERLAAIVGKRRAEGVPIRRNESATP